MNVYNRQKSMYLKENKDKRWICLKALNTLEDINEIKRAIKRMDEMEKGKWQLLPSCSKEAEGLDIILACDGAASVGQEGHDVAVKLTKLWI